MKREDSGAGWSDVRRGSPASVADATADEAANAAHPFAASEAERYQDVDWLGEGGMGIVRATIDRRLGREVALKTVRAPDDPRAAKRLAREAWLTARLEHPGIVAVHDAGQRDGVPYYTMRLVRGRTFADWLTGHAALAGRLRHFLAVTQAMAHAHDHGVVHRDLKPANILIGQHGETVVVDWGLAAMIGGEGAMVDGTGTVTAAAEEVPTVPTLPLHATSIAGTPGFMSPEQVSGQPPDPTDDVWALGHILRDIVQTASPVVDASHDPELWSIVSKSCAAHPKDRYAKASDLATDVAAYLDGRTVGAHRYAPRDLLLRLLRSWRGPLIALGLGLVLAGVVFALTWRRVVGERTRARAAELVATSALAASERQLRESLTTQAEAEFRAGRWGDAEVFAARALRIGDAVRARGVIMGAHAGPRPSLTFRATPVACERILAAADDWLLCGVGEEVQLWRGQVPVWRKPWMVAEALALAEGRIAILRMPEGLEVVSAQDGTVLASSPAAVAQRRPARSRDGRWVAAATSAHALELVDSQRGARFSSPRMCAPAHLQAFALGDATVAALCSDQRLILMDFEGKVRRIHPLSYGNSRRVLSMAVAPGDLTIYAGEVEGGLWSLHLPTNTVTPRRQVAQQAIEQVHKLAMGVLVVTPSRQATLWTDDGTERLIALPDVKADAIAVSATSVLALGRGVHRWQFPSALERSVVAMPAGVSSAVLSTDLAWWAVARGDGIVSVWPRDATRPVRELAVGADVIKDVAFSPDGRRLAAAVAVTVRPPKPGVMVWSMPDLTSLPYERSLAARATRFVTAQALVAAPYDVGLDVWSDNGVRRAIAGAQITDLTAAEGAASAWAITREDRVVRWDGDGLIDVAAAAGAFALAASRDGKTIALVSAQAVRVLAGQALASITMPTRADQVTALAVDPDGRWLALGLRSGDIEVWNLARRQLVAILPGHRERVGSLRFSGDLLVSASWDGTSRLWAWSALDQGADELVASVERTWTFLEAEPQRPAHVMVP